VIFLTDDLLSIYAAGEHIVESSHGKSVQVAEMGVHVGGKSTTAIPDRLIFPEERNRKA
jgi:hypothetical protein